MSFLFFCFALSCIVSSLFSDSFFLMCWFAFSLILHVVMVFLMSYFDSLSIVARDDWFGKPRTILSLIISSVSEIPEVTRICKLSESCNILVYTFTFFLVSGIKSIFLIYNIHLRFKVLSNSCQNSCLFLSVIL